MTTSIKVKSLNTNTDLFSIIKNEDIFYNKEEVSNITQQLLNQLDDKLITTEFLFQLVNMIKNVIQKNKNVHLDPLFSVSYVLLFLFKKNTISSVSSKVLFSYAGIYSQLNENEKSCVALMKQFEIEKGPMKDFNSKQERNCWIVSEYNKLCDTLGNINKEIFYMVSNTMGIIDLGNLVQNEYKMNFFILFINNINNLASNGKDNCVSLLEKIYEFLVKSADIFKNRISQVHFNNLIKVICKIIENLVKNGENNHFLYLSNKFKIFLYDLLFSSSYAQIDTTLIFISNHITELLILQKTRNWKNSLQKQRNFLEENLINCFFSFVVSKLEAYIEKDKAKQLAYINIVGKIYNFYNNLSSEKSLLYSDKILSFYICSQIVINETVMIKVNMFRDFLNEHKSFLHEDKVSKNVMADIEELSLLFRSLKLLQDSDADVFIIILRYLIKCLDNLLILLNSLKNYRNLWDIAEKIDDLLEILLAEHQAILSKKKEINEVTKFHNYAKIFLLEEDNNDTKKFSLIFHKFLGDKIYQADDLKTKISLCISYFTKTAEVEKNIYIILYLSKLHYEIYSHSVLSIITSLSKEGLSLIGDNKLYFYTEKLLEILLHFEKESDSKYTPSIHVFEKENFFSRLEKLLIFLFSSIINLVVLQMKRNNFEEFTSSCSKFFNYYKLVSELNEKFKSIFKFQDYFVNEVILLEFFENALVTDEVASLSVSFIKKSILSTQSNNLLSELITNRELDDFFQSICLDYIITRKENSNKENVFECKWEDNSSVVVQFKKFYLDLIRKQIERENKFKNENKKKIDFGKVVQSISELYAEIYESSDNVEVIKNLLEWELSHLSNRLSMLRNDKINLMIYKENFSIFNSIQSLFGEVNKQQEDADLYNVCQRIKEKLQKETLYNLDYYTMMIDFSFLFTHILADNYFQLPKEIFDYRDKLNFKIKNGATLNTSEWIILLKILFFESKYSYQKNIRPKQYTTKELNEYFLKSSLFLDYALSILKKIFDSQTLFQSYLSKKISKLKNFFKRKSDVALEGINFDVVYSTYICELIYNIKEICRGFFKLSYRLNFSDKFFEFVNSLSSCSLVFLDKEFCSVLLGYIIRFFMKWYKKVDINPKQYDLKNIQEYTVAMFKIMLIYCNLKDSGVKHIKIDELQYDSDNINKMMKYFKNVLNTNMNNDSQSKSQIKCDKRLLKFATKFYDFLNKKKTVIMNKYFSDCSNDIEYFMLNFANLKLSKKMIRIVKTNESLVKDNFDVIQFVRQFLNCVDKELHNNSYVHLKMKKYKYFKNLLETIIARQLPIKRSDTIIMLLEFYITKLLNYNIELLSNRNTDTDTDTNTNENSNEKEKEKEILTYNYFSFFKIKKYFLFTVFYENQLYYSATESEVLQNQIEELKDIFSGLILGNEDKTDKAEWWKRRMNQENRLFKCLLSLQYLLINSNEKLKDKIKQIYTSNPKFIQSAILYYDQSRERNKTKFEDFTNNLLEDLLSYKEGNNKIRKCNIEFLKDFYNLRDKNSKSQTNPISDLYSESKIHLIMSSELANFPVENMPIFFKLPIVRTLNYSLLKSVKRGSNTIKVNKKDIHYLINPSKDLKDTEENLKPLFVGIEGVAGKEPNKGELEDRLKRLKVFAYCGHSNGCKYVDPNFIKYSEELNYISFLMGCSSVKIENLCGRNDQPFDIASYYQMNGCPSLLGCLWNVTDADIDKFFRTVIEQIFIQKKTESILEAVLYAKHSCKLRNMNGSALVLYSTSDLKIITDNF